MRAETKTVYVGENVGPVDWSYDFRSHYDCLGTSNERRDEACEIGKARLCRIEEALRNGEEVRATTYGGWPRCGIHRVVEVGMYDGWPYWRPVPSVATAGPFGLEWHSFSSITDIYVGDSRDEWRSTPAPGGAETDA